MNETMSAMPPKKVAMVIISTLILAVVVLVTLVLPAEYNYDPLGTGAALGLTGLSETPVAALEQQSKGYANDVIELALEPFESVEYKYHLEEGDVLLYEWDAGSKVVVDMHADPLPELNLSESTYLKGKFNADKGSYRAQFAGLHGWWWQNRGAEPVKIKLRSSGFYSLSTEYRDNSKRDYSF